MDESIGGACKHNGVIGDKETVAVELYSSIYFELLHVAKVYIRTYGTYHTHMVYKIVPYAYGTYHTHMVCTIRIWYKIRIWYRTYTFAPFMNEGTCLLNEFKYARHVQKN